MKYLVSTVSAVFIFFAAWFILGFFFAAVLPISWFDIEIQIGSLTANIPSLLSIVGASIAATSTFKASLSAKTGKLYRRGESKK
ncbi:MAG: hypothetical protein JW947_06250 [Sedimentisphaerales bacterium]|nr:hypothetical protein [Sedimentisphaerales bacterium]